MMTQQTFKLFTEQYLYQEIDKMDKNYSSDDTKKTNEGRMYCNEGTLVIIFDQNVQFH